MIDLRTRYRPDNPETSREAVERLDSSHPLTEIQMEVLAAFKDAGARGIADFELNEWFECTTSTYRTRRSELTRLGILKDSGRRMVNPKGGNRFVVWVLSEFATGDE